MNMNLKMLMNDFKRNRAGNVALLLFITLAATLVAAATIVVSLLISSMSGMYQTAKPPHFLQMHKGEINQEAIDEFNSSYNGITASQTVAMIDVYGDNLTVYGDETFRLSDCRLDISLVKQNREYDLLLDENRNLIHVNPGEIGIPIILLDAYDINLGDTIVLSSNGITKKFIVTVFVHDAQMNSTLCASTRMLISDEDFEELFGHAGVKEYLIEAYFTDSSMATDYQTAYENANLPQNSQAVTYTIIILLSALTDIMMAMVLILVSMLLVIIALLCMKYTIMAALEEELGEIGTLKAIGISYKDIRNLYLEKYKMIVAVGIVLGYTLALILSNVFSGHVSNTFGKQKFSVLSILLPMVACIFIYLITLRYCKKILKKLKKVTVVDALVTGKGFGKKEHARDGLYKSKKLNVNLLISLRETLHNFSGFIIVFVVMFIATGIIIVPVNLINTMESEEFISYMGSSMDDILIEIDTGNHLENQYENIRKLLKVDSDIEEFKEFQRFRVETMKSDEEWVNIQVDSGKDAGKELKYLDGKAPSSDNEISLSKLNADEIDKSTGDDIIISYNDNQMKFVISGIYQDVTSGGYSAKAINHFSGVEVNKYQFTVNLRDGVNAKEKANQWSKLMGGGYDIEPMDEFINQTLGGVTRQVKIATTAVVVIGILLASLIVLLFMKLRLVKDMAQIAALKAIGFTNTDVRIQYLYKVGMVSIIGIITGTLVSNILGERLVSAAFRTMGLGLSKITFIINPWIAFGALPFILLIAAGGMTYASTNQIREYHIISLINE